MKVKILTSGGFSQWAPAIGKVVDAIPYEEGVLLSAADAGVIENESAGFAYKQGSRYFSIRFGEVEVVTETA